MAALIAAVVPCCPFVSVIGGTLAVIALRRIDHSAGRLSGRRTAILAAMIALGMTIVSTIGMAIMQSSVNQLTRDSVVEQVEFMVRESAEGRTAPAAGRWAARPTDAPPAAVLEQFGRITTDRYGKLRRFTITSLVPNDNILAPQIEVAGIFVFDRGERTGSARFQIQSGYNGHLLTFWFREFRIDDPQLGPISLPGP